VLNRELDELEIHYDSQDDLICMSQQVLGNGIINSISDIILVDINTYDRAKSRDVAQEIGQFNMKMIREKLPYLLIGVGRWGSLDPWLGIPVSWDMISGANVIVETGFKDFKVTPSQGSHFFQNITSFRIGYFTINSIQEQGGFIDWDWLLARPVEEQKTYCRHIKFDDPMLIKINGHQNKGIIIKPNSMR
jgi:hypothetical protein